jgi:hypothetical protein
MSAQDFDRADSDERLREALSELHSAYRQLSHVIEDELSCKPGAEGGTDTPYINATERVSRAMFRLNGAMLRRM